MDIDVYVFIFVTESVDVLNDKIKHFTVKQLIIPNTIINNVGQAFILISVIE